MKREAEGKFAPSGGQNGFYIFLFVFLSSAYSSAEGSDEDFCGLFLPEKYHLVMILL